MNYICPECRNDVSEESDFCHRCGRKTDDIFTLEDVRSFADSDLNKCTVCGRVIPINDPICPGCGEPRSKTQMLIFRPKLVRYGWIGIALALIGGILVFLPLGPVGPLTGMFSVYGLGHFYFRKWKRGLWFLAITAMMISVRFIGGEMTMLTHIIFIVASVFFFLMQTMEVVTLAFIPPRQRSDMP